MFLAIRIFAIFARFAYVDTTEYHIFESRLIGKCNFDKYEPSGLRMVEGDGKIVPGIDQEATVLSNIANVLVKEGLPYFIPVAKLPKRRELLTTNAMHQNHRHAFERKFAQIFDVKRTLISAAEGDKKEITTYDTVKYKSVQNGNYSNDSSAILEQSDDVKVVNLTNKADIFKTLNEDVLKGLNKMELCDILKLDHTLFDNNVMCSTKQHASKRSFIFHTNDTRVNELYKKSARLQASGNELKEIFKGWTKCIKRKKSAEVVRCQQLALKSMLAKESSFRKFHGFMSVWNEKNFPPHKYITLMEESFMQSRSYNELVIITLETLVNLYENFRNGTQMVLYKTYLAQLKEEINKSIEYSRFVFKFITNPRYLMKQSTCLETLTCANTNSANGIVESLDCQCQMREDFTAADVCKVNVHIYSGFGPDTTVVKAPEDDFLQLLNFRAKSILTLAGKRFYEQLKRGAMLYWLKEVMTLVLIWKQIAHKVDGKLKYRNLSKRMWKVAKIENSARRTKGATHLNLGHHRDILKR